MEPKEAVERQSIPATFPYSGKEDARAVKDLDSVTLLRLCANDQNDSDAWHEFLSRVIDKIRFFVFRASRLDYGRASPDTIAQRRTTCLPESEDLVQEVLVRLVENDCLLLKRFDGETEESLLRYLAVISSSVVINRYKFMQRLRRRSNHSQLDEVDDALLERVGLSRDDLNIEQSILIREIMQILADLLREEVPKAETRVRDLLIFKLHFFEGLSISDISRYCGINLSVRGVDKIIAKLTRRLQERFGRRGGEHE